MSRCLLLLVLISSAFAQTQYDLLLKGGRVIDAKNGIDGRRDVAILDGKIAAVSENIPASQALKTVNVSNYIVSPGLIDIHVHMYAGTGGRNYAGDLSLYPDNHTFRSGVTTVVDAGTSGYETFEDFKQRVIDRSKTRVLALLNIVGKGMSGSQGERVEQNTSDMDPKATAAMVKKYPDTVVGIKTAHYSGPEWIAVDRGVEAAKEAGVFLMVDFGDFRAERPFQELVLKHLRPGDIYTHMYLYAVPMLDEHGKVQQYLFDARKRGVLFDVGHGGGSFLFRQAVPAIKQGFVPDSISTDMHYNSANAGMKDMTNVMSKILNIGMPLRDVIAKSTWAPAREIHREELGNLSVGSPADVTVLSLQKGDFGFVDTYGARMKGTQKLVAELTIREGKVVWDLNGITRENWDKLDANYGAQGDPRWDGTGVTRARRRPQRH